jgi:1,2-diacylglycerol 3-alpha-glucosyltransferase
LAAVVRAFAEYRRRSEVGRQGADLWHLVILGDGPLKADLQSLISELDLQDFVLLPGFKQYDDLPACYGFANALILASTTEQWGLVVNEGMAAGLPIIVSGRCGCVPELVHDGVNGFQFDPHDEQRLAELMSKVAAASDEQRTAWGEASLRIIVDWNLDRFARGVERASKVAKQHEAPCRSRFLVPLILNLIGRFR